MITMRWASSLTQVPGPVAGKRRVTEAVAALVVSTLLGENNWQLIQKNSLATASNQEPEEISPLTGAPATPCPSVPSVVNGFWFSVRYTELDDHFARGIHAR